MPRPNKALRSLATLAPGEGGTIAETPPNLRLAELGLIRGQFVRVLGVAPLGDPVVLALLDTPLVVRRAELEGILIRG
ncbi:MAG: ferrous iron transport protein A [Leptospiraceae bacterium]|nr:ferrous iron transport protein A [Leptospiraceae bacterium]